MKHFYLIIFAAFSLCANCQIISFPDANFKAKLLQPGVARDEMDNFLILDANDDGEIEVNEVQNVYYLNVSYGGITNLSGISNFSGLQFLDCSHNSLTTITIDNSIQLMGINASYNQLTSVNVDLTLAVEGVDLSHNNLSSFAVVGGYYAENFDLSYNQLTSLTLNNVVFYRFYVNNNNLSSIQYVGMVEFYNLVILSDNQFTILDFPNINFGNSCWLSFGGNVVDRLHFSGSQPGNLSYHSSNNTFVDFGNWYRTRDCDPEESGNVTIYNSPNLRHAIFKNGMNHANLTCNEGGTIFQIPALHLQISNCPNLSYICVDEGEQANFQQRINDIQLQNQVQVNSYCTFEPGGDYYTITGTTRFDTNANGCDAGDSIVANQKFTITNGTQTSTIISGDVGNYSIDVGPGTHTITPIIDNPSFFNVTPSNAVVDFPTQSSPLLQDFCISAAAPSHDFDITLIPLNAARPGFDANYKIVFKNLGNVTDDGNIVLAYQDNVLDFVSASQLPDSNSGGNLTWSFSNLAPFETRIITVTFNLNGPMETPPLNGNDVLDYTTSIAQTGIVPPFLNNHTLHQTLVTSFDPNDKVCLEGENLANSFIGNYVSYKIRFENTGNFAAENIVVKDMIDATKFDVSSLMPIASSHPFYTRITGDKVEFVFEDINLPFDDANNDGYVVFKIKLLPTVTENIPFANQASIYFDYNFPVVTNTATSVIGTLATPVTDVSNRFTLAPVPAQDILQIRSNDNLTIQNIEIYNNLGQIVQKEIGNPQNIDVSRLAKGSYYLKIYAEGLTSVKQFLKE